MNEGTASVVRTLIKTAGVVIIFIGWPQFRKSHVFNQTVIQPSEASDLVMRSVIMELKVSQPSLDYVFFERVVDVGETGVRTDEYSMLRSDWESNGRPDSISITVSSLAEGANV